MAVKSLEVVEAPTGVDSAFPVPRVRPPQEEGAAERFSDSDEGIDLTRLPVIGPGLTKAIKSRRFQFSLILPNQIIFWLVVVAGIFGVTDPTMNFGTAITWYIWFAMMFTMTLAVGRAWCVMCPFGGFGEWIQRRTFWKRTQKALGLGWRLPESWARYGLVMSALVFIGMTWAEEFFDIAGPGAPIMTSFMILGIVGASTLTFLLFERRTFCRYFCPLSSLVGSAGSSGMIAGFRTRDRKKCLECPTKECMRGGKEGYGCPWYTYPATADTNTYCGLCSECYKACPYDNIGVYAQKPLNSVVAPRKRTEIAWVVALLFGLVIFQQVNALGSYTVLDDWLNNVLHFPGYPNPVDYVLIIGAVVGVFAGVTFLLSKALAFKTRLAGAFSGWFAPLMYGLIPLMGADYVARAMPKFFNNAARLPASILGVFGKQVSWAGFQILPNNWLVGLQIGIAGAGTLAAIYAVYKIASRDFKELTPHNKMIRLVPSLLVLGLGLGIVALFVFMNGAE